MKKIKWVLLVLVLLVVVLITGVFMGIDRIARVAVEAGATYALGVKTTLNSMHIGILSGSAEMGQLSVANPSGFTSPHFLRLGDARLAVSLGSLMGKCVEVPEISLSKIDMSLEKKGGQSNYKVILDGLKKFESSGPAPAESKGGRTFVIRHAVVRDINVDVNMIGIGGDLTRLPVKIEQIEIQDIGTDSAGGAKLAEVSAILLKAIIHAVVTKADHVLPAEIADELTAGLKDLKKLSGDSVKVVGEVTGKLGGELKRMGEVGEKLGEGLEAAGKEAEKGLKDAGKKAEDGLKGLLPGKKKEEKP